jgi:hypothetical protein
MAQCHDFLQFLITNVIIFNYKCHFLYRLKIQDNNPLGWYSNSIELGPEEWSFSFCSAGTAEEANPRSLDWANAVLPRVQQIVTEFGSRLSKATVFFILKRCNLRRRLAH